MKPPTKWLLGALGLGLVSLAAWKVFSGGRRTSGCRQVVLLGDSTIGGYALRQELEDLIGPCSTVQVKSYTGKGTGAILSHVAEALALEPTDLVVLAGVNDLASGRGLAGIEVNLEAIYAAGRAARARVIAVQVLPWGGWASGGAKHVEDTAALNTWISTASSADVIVSTEAMGDGAGSLHPDFDDGKGLHPNATGQAALAQLIYEQGF